MLVFIGPIFIIQRSCCDFFPCLSSLIFNTHLSMQCLARWFGLSHVGHSVAHNVDTTVVAIGSATQVLYSCAPSKMYHLYIFLQMWMTCVCQMWFHIFLCRHYSCHYRQELTEYFCSEWNSSSFYHFFPSKGKLFFIHNVRGNAFVFPKLLNLREEVER